MAGTDAEEMTHGIILTRCTDGWERREGGAPCSSPETDSPLGLQMTAHVAQWATVVPQRVLMPAEQQRHCPTADRVGVPGHSRLSSLFACGPHRGAPGIFGDR